MALNLQQLQSDDAAYVKQATDARNAQQSQEAMQGGQQPEPSFLQRWVTGPMGRVTTSMVDSAVSTADSFFDSPVGEKARDAVAGVTTGAMNMADAARSGEKSLEESTGARSPLSLANISDPVWNHAKQHILDFRDAVAVQDPTLADHLTQGVAQLAVPFAGYSRALGAVHGLANMLAAGAATDATALGPHDARMADLIALGRHTEGKLGDALRAMAPDGSAFNSYINYLTDRSNETEAQGRWKNVLDGFGANLVATPLIHAAGIVLKQGTAGLRYAVENGVGSTSDIVGPASQQGKIGYHGTGLSAKGDDLPFNEFDNSKIGTGEGAQVFGYGHYIAESPETAGTYQSRLTAQVNGYMGEAMDNAKDAVLKAGSPAKAYKQMIDMAGDEQSPTLRDKMLAAARLIKSGNYNRASGSLLKVDVPDEDINKMLDWDKPLSQQKLPQAVMNKIEDYRSSDEGNEGIRNVLLDPKATGADLKMVLEHTMGAARAAKFLDESGVPGIKYLDQKSRGQGEGTRNYVVFDGKRVKVLGAEK